MEYLMKKLQNKTALITGGNSGIGLETAKLFKEQGAQVIITASSDDSYQSALKEFGGIFDIVKVDVNSPEQLDNLYGHIKSKYAKLDILFANAGIGGFCPLDQISPEHFDAIFNTNVKGLLFSIQKALPLLAKGSSVIVTSSTLHSKGSAGSTVYSATKAAVRSFVRTWSNEIPVEQVRFNILSPGPIHTPIWNKMGLSDESKKEFSEQIIKTIPAKRFGTSQEIAKTALFLASDDSSYIVGADISADGGFSNV